MKFNENYELLKEFVDDNLPKYLSFNAAISKNILTEAMDYSLTAGGKRFRPVLHLATVQLLGGDCKDFIDSACALEYIHTYSLIHDDLPAMDNDDYRRGKLTNHKVFGEGMAILAGDALLNSAFEILLEKIRSRNDIHIIEGVQTIIERSGGKGMVLGQSIDLQNTNTTMDFPTLTLINEYKTGALIEASILSAAIMLRADEESIKALRAYSYYLGLAFQLSDDILDVEGNFSETGKSIGSDMENDKSTMVAFLGLEKAKETLSDYVDAAIESIAIFKDNNFLVEVVNYMKYRSV